MKNGNISKNDKKIIGKNLFFYLERVAVLFAIIAYLEIQFHLLSVETDYKYIPMKLAAALPLAALFALFTSFWGKRAAGSIEAVFVGFLTVYYSINLLYHSAFKVYFSIKLINASNTKIAQYYREIWANIKLNKWGLVLLLVIPLAAYITLRARNIIKYNRVSIKLFYIPIAALAVFVGIEVLCINVYGKGSFSPFELIVKENVSDFSFARVGVLATGGIEIKDQILPKREEEQELDVWVYNPDNNSAISNGAGSVDGTYGNGTYGNGTYGDGTYGDGTYGNGTYGNGTNGNRTYGDGTYGDGTFSNEAYGDLALPNSGDSSGNINDPDNGKQNIERVIDTSPNMLNIDFVALSENESNKEVSNIHKYFASVEPSYKNEYTGMFEGYNLIFLTCEAFCPLAVDEQLTPTLYKLVNEGFVFNNFYNPRTSGSTSDGEFVCSTSLVPTNGGATNFRIAGQNSMPFALGNMFNMKYGITSRAYHNNDYTYYDRHVTYPGMGYYYTGIGNGMEISRSWPESDLEMMEATVSEYIDDDLFHVYYMTVSGHMNYNFGGNAMSMKHYDEVKDLPYSTACKAYIGCQMELDKALEYLVNSLYEKGIADKTVICFTGDHWPYGLTNDEYSELLGHEVEPNFELYKSNLVLWSGSIKEPIVIDKYCSSMDILPTLLNLFGFDYDSRLLMGRDILSNTEGFVIFINRSFITDKVIFNSMNGQVTYLTDDTLPDDYVSNARETLNNRWKYSQKIMDTDYYKYICSNLGIEIPIVTQNYSY